MCSPLRRVGLGRDAEMAAANPPLLTFEACGGLTNQRISIVQGLLVAHLTHRAVVLPQLNPNGVQNPVRGYVENRSRLMSFDAFFNRNATAAALEALGIRVASSRQQAAAAAHAGSPQRKVYSLTRKTAWFGQFRGKHGPPVLRLDCAYGAIDMLSASWLQQLYWQLDAALVLAPALAALAEQVVRKLRRRSIARGAGGAFNALHIRVQPDWLVHCQRWETHTGERPRDNCMRNTDQLDRVLAIEGVSELPPLFVAGELQASTLSTVRGLKALSRRGGGNGRSHDLLSKDALVPGLLDSYSFASSRDLLAAVDFAICSQAHTFIGNSVSTFAAYQLLLRERRRRQRWPAAQTADGSSRTAHSAAQEGFHYNGGSIPLRDVMFANPREAAATTPSRGLKWVFTVTGNVKSYDEMTRVAVLSALANTTLTPVCVFTGARNGLSRWLEAHGVRMVYHRPAWRSSLIGALARARSLRHDKVSSPLYHSDEKMVSTFLRIDIPTLGFVDPYVLYTDVDVFFVSDVGVGDFGERPPRYFTMGAESNGPLISIYDRTLRKHVKTGNAGVMLMNVENLLRTHAEFTKWLFSPRNAARGIHFGIYGPGDQGAYNEFYQGRFEVLPWPLFNWKPYWGYTPEAKLIHFHGPKPSEYFTFMRRGGGTLAPLYRTLLKRCKAEPPGAQRIEALDGRGCYTYLVLWQRWRSSHRFHEGNGQPRW